MSILDDDWPDIEAARKSTYEAMAAWIPAKDAGPYFGVYRSGADTALERLRMYADPSDMKWRPYQRRTRKRARIVLH